MLKKVPNEGDVYPAQAVPYHQSITEILWYFVCALLVPWQQLQLSWCRPLQLWLMDPKEIRSSCGQPSPDWMPFQSS